jgi:hypothetical protein
LGEQSPADRLTDGLLSEWRPTRATILAWTFPAVLASMAADGVYGYVALRGAIPNSWSIDLAQALLEIGLVFGFAAIHEAIHGAAFLAFGARPTFGIFRVAGRWVGLYTSAPGRRFSAREYVTICLAPVVLLTPLGLLACLLPFGVYLAWPLGIVFGGNIGDVTITWHVLRAGRGVRCEDMPDGTRFWSVEPSGT